MKHRYILLIMSLIICLFLSTIVVAQEEEELVDPDIPESWYEAPKKASEMDINEFDQSHVLDEKVKEGELPPVEERLPDDPPVIEPYEEVGKYGGTISVWSTSLDSIEDAVYSSNTPTTAGRPAPDGGENLPYFLEDWEYSDDATEITLYLRRGIKFSDGTPLTADDYLYWWEHEANNEEWSNVLPKDWKPVALEEVEKIDDYTVKFIFAEPNPRIDDFEFQDNMGPGIYGEVVSEDFMKDYHPDFVGEEAVVEMAKEVELDNWDEYYGRIRDDSPLHPDYEHQRPVLNPYIAVERSETQLILERNPYYPFIDTEGNQLPYVDRIKVNLANDEEMASSKAATGEATFSARNLKTEDIPLYKQNEEQENYSTFIYKRAYGNEVVVHPNLSHEDSELRDIFQDSRFRKALSYGIDRENINNKVYFEKAEPRQNNVHPLNDFYKEEYGKAYAEYNPKRAEELLDKIGMEDVDGDGYREFPNGDEFKPQLLYCKMGAIDPTSTLELIRSGWQKIGIDIDLKMVSRELHDQRCAANDMDMTVWTGGGTLNIRYGKIQDIGRTFAPTGNPYYNSWPGWTNWYTSDGEEGMEPPQEIKELIEYAEELGYSPDEETRKEAGRKLAEAQAENLWGIGTVGSGPQPIIVSNKLKNVPKKGLWAWQNRYMKPMYPVQFYLDD